ncbi:putative ribonuclease H-like domain-containing protein [Tanacetum coccineum]
MSGSQDDIPPPPPPSQTPTQQTPHAVSTIKLHILKKGEYDIWAMKMEHYLAHTDYHIWEVIQNGNGHVSITTDTQGQIKVLPLRTAEEILARERERKARTTLLMALPEDHLAKFHKMTDAKEMWEAIKSRFGRNDESKKMQKYILKQQFEGFSVSNSEGHKRLYRFKPGLEFPDQEDPCQEWETSPSFDDLYNNLRSLMRMSGSTASSSKHQNVVILFWTSLDEFDLEEMDLKWQVVMISMRMKKFYKKTGHFARECRTNGNQDSKRRDAWNSGNKDLAQTQSDASIEIKAYTLALKKVEAQLVAHQQGQLWETVKNQFTHIKNPKVDKKGLRYGFTTKACFVCGSISHLIRDCDFHEKRMAKQVELNKQKGKGSSQREIRLVWNNVQRVNHKNQFVPTAVLTRTGRIPVSIASASGTNNVSTAKHNFNSQAVLTNASRKISTVKPFVNRVRPKTIFHKTHSPFRRPFNNTTTLRTKFSKQKVNTAEVNAVSAVGGKRETAVKPSAGLSTCFVKELQHFNLFSVSQICDKKNKVLFTDSECLVLSPEFKLPDANQVLLRIPRQSNMYSFNLENIVPSGGLACLIAKATIDESNKWHRRLGHVNFKNLNKLVKGNLVRGLPSKIFQNDHTCVACQKGKQHKASCKAKSVSSISQPLQLLHMDLFGPTSVRSLNHKTYCLVITDDFSRFSWVFFLRTKDETSGILKDFIRQIENQLNQKVKTIRCDNGTEFKNRDVIEFCGSKGIKREYSNARTPQQNGVAERKNRTLIEAARTMLADLFLPNTFWAEAVSTACYVLNRVLVTKPQNKTPYELVTGKIPIISYIRPFGCHVTILNTIDHLGKFEGKSDEGFLVGYSLQSKAFRVYNLETKRVEENLHITFLENKPNVEGKGPTWLFDLDYLTDLMNYQHVRSENQANKHAGPQEANQNAIKSSKVSEEPTKHPDFKQVDKEDQVFLDELERLKRQEQVANDAAEALRKVFA